MFTDSIYSPKNTFSNFLYSKGWIGSRSSFFRKKEYIEPVNAKYSYL